MTKKKYTELGDILYSIADATQGAGAQNHTSDLLQTTLKKNIAKENIKYTLLNEIITINNDEENGRTTIAANEDKADYLDDLFIQINDFCKMDFAADMKPLIRTLNNCITIYWLTYENNLFSTIEDTINEKISCTKPQD